MDRMTSVTHEDEHKHESEERADEASAESSDQAEPRDDGDAPIELEPLASMAPELAGDGVDPELATDTCPKCGAPMPDEQSVVCLRCGYNLHTKAFVVTEDTGREDEATSEDEGEDDGDDSSSGSGRGPSGPVSAEGRGNFVIPLAMAAIAGVVLIIGFLSGNQGLLPVAWSDDLPATDSVPFFSRLFGLLRLVMLVGLWSVSGVIGLAAMAKVRNRPAGDLVLGAGRMLAIVLSMRLVTFIDFRSIAMEWAVEVPLQIPVAFLGMLLFFRVSVREVIDAMMYAAVAFVVVWGAAYVVTYATQPVVIG